MFDKFMDWHIINRQSTMNVSREKKELLSYLLKSI